MLSLRNNSETLLANRYLAQSNSALGSSLERLSTGSKVNRAQDAPADLQITELQRAQLGGLTQAVSNLDRASSMLETADAGLEQISQMLIQARILAVDSGNTAVHSDTSLASNRAELKNLLAAIDEVATSTRYGNKLLIDGSKSSIGATTTGISLSSTQQQIITPFNVTTTLPGNSSTVNIQNVINQKGLSSASLTATHDTTSTNGFQSKTSTTGTRSITIALGASYKLDTLALFNGLGTDGLRQVSIQTSTNGVSFSTVSGGTNYTINQVNASSPYTGQQFSFATGGVTATHLRLLISNNHGGTRYNFNEVVIRGTPTTNTTLAAGATYLGSTGETFSTGTYDINVTRAAEKAVVHNNVRQTSNISTAETLTINGVAIALAAGTSQANVVVAINAKTAQTGVTADTIGGFTRLRTATYGSSATISVVSSRAAASNSSGFGNTTQTAVGVNVAGTIGGATGTGSGDVLTANGAQVQIAASGDNITTRFGTLAKLNVTNSTLRLQTGSSVADTASVGLSGAVTSQIGLNASGASGGSNRFSSLAGIDIVNDGDAQDAIIVIDKAIKDIASQRGQVGATLSSYVKESQENARAQISQLSTAISNVRDTNFGVEIGKLVNEQIRNNVANYVLKLTSAKPKTILNLLDYAAQPVSRFRSRR